MGVLEKAAVYAAFLHFDPVFRSAADLKLLQAWGNGKPAAGIKKPASVYGLLVRCYELPQPSTYISKVCKRVKRSSVIAILQVFHDLYVCHVNTVIKRLGADSQGFGVAVCRACV